MSSAKCRPFCLGLNVLTFSTKQSPKPNKCYISEKQIKQELITISGGNILDDKFSMDAQTEDKVWLIRIKLHNINNFFW